MNWYESVKRYYDLGFYKKEDVARFVFHKKINEEEYQKITGEAYVAQQ